MLRIVSSLFMAALLGAPCLAQASSNTGAGPCQLQASQEEAKWAFEIEYVYSTPTWSAEKSAADLLLLQAQYFSGKTSPFMHNQIPSELAYYDPHATFSIKPYVTYTQTLDGRSCAQVVGAKLVIKHEPEIFLARELAVRNCVSKAALAHQLRHDQIAIDELKEIAAARAVVKKMVFPTYEKQGAAGLTANDIARQLATMEKAATQEIATFFANNVRINRKQRVETRNNFMELYGMCQGEFEKATQLALPPSTGAKE